MTTYFFSNSDWEESATIFLSIKLHTSYRQKKEASVGADASSERKDKNAMSKEL